MSDRTAGFLDVPCPTCGAKAGHRCTGHKGVTVYPHDDRIADQRDRWLTSIGYEPLGRGRE